MGMRMSAVTLLDGNDVGVEAEIGIGLNDG